jgi:hypothetical protein
MSDAASGRVEAPHGLALLSGALTADALNDAPVLESVDASLIDKLSDDEDEDEGFGAALDTWARRRYRCVQRRLE